MVAATGLPATLVTIACKGQEEELTFPVQASHASTWEREFPRQILSGTPHLLRFTIAHEGRQADLPATGFHALAWKGGATPSRTTPPNLTCEIMLILII